MSSYFSSSSLEEKLADRSEALEEAHLEAAIDAQLTVVDDPDASNANPIIVEENKDPDASSSASSRPKEEAIFDDYSNPNAVANCLSPFVPSAADRIDAFVDFVGLKESDTLLDIGSGDGRVCIASSKLTSCQSIGIDVSPLCIRMARDVANEEQIANRCTFYEADATLDPDLFVRPVSPLAEELRSVTVVFLYTYPTLLQKLVPLLERMTTDSSFKVRAVVTLTYHLPNEQVKLVTVNDDGELRWYTKVFASAH